MATVDVSISPAELDKQAPQDVQNGPTAHNSEFAKLDEYSQTIALTVNDTHSQLAAPLTNTPEQQSIPRDIISSSISTTRLQSELQRPLLAGTYSDVPAYLLKLQFQFLVPKGSQSWLKRIQTASISVVLEDAPAGEVVQKSRNRRTARLDAGAKHPNIIKTFPGAEGWEGPVSTRVTSNEVGVGLQAGWAGLGAEISWSQSRSRDEAGTVKVDTMRTGPQRNSLLVTISENPVSANGIPAFVVIPLLVGHHQRRVSMRVTVKATFGFWRGKLAESVPVLGRADDPVFFDPAVLEKSLELGDKGVDGTKIIDFAGNIWWWV